VPALSGNRILFRDGVPLALQVGGETRMLEEIETDREWQAKKALARRALPPRVRTYLGG
jgi:ATP-dependent Lhr-like helicase